MQRGRKNGVGSDFELRKKMRRRLKTNWGPTLYMTQTSRGPVPAPHSFSFIFLSHEPSCLRPNVEPSPHTPFIVFLLFSFSFTSFLYPPWLAAPPFGPALPLSFLYFARPTDSPPSYLIFFHQPHVSSNPQPLSPSSSFLHRENLSS